MSKPATAAAVASASGGRSSYRMEDRTAATEAMEEMSLSAPP